MSEIPTPARTECEPPVSFDVCDFAKPEPKSSEGLVAWLTWNERHTKHDHALLAERTRELERVKGERDEARLFVKSWLEWVERGHIMYTESFFVSEARRALKEQG